MFILDSGATSKDSRGTSIWVSEGNIKALVSTRKQTYCISRDFRDFADKWIVLTLTWNKEKGSYFICSGKKSLKMTKFSLHDFYHADCFYCISKKNVFRKLLVKFSF